MFPDDVILKIQHPAWRREPSPALYFAPLLATAILFASCVDATRHPVADIGKDIVRPVKIKVSKAPEPSVFPVVQADERTVAQSEERPTRKIQNQPVLLNKSDFFSFMKPIVEAENERILQARRHLLRLKSSARLQIRAISWLHEIAVEYHILLNWKPDNRFWNQILSRVDIVPLEMALAQAANESAWGNSRFAREANNYFGQWCFREGCGIVPLRRNIGASHEVRRFDSPALSVRSYIKNMNTLHAYSQFRLLRQSMRHRGKMLDAELLAIGLRRYSERGGSYVKIIRSIIRKNRTLMRKS